MLNIVFESFNYLALCYSFYVRIIESIVGTIGIGWFGDSSDSLICVCVCVWSTLRYNPPHPPAPVRWLMSIQRTQPKKIIIIRQILGSNCSWSVLQIDCNEMQRVCSVLHVIFHIFAGHYWMNYYRWKQLKHWKNLKTKK